jgi:hypothetical protein
MTWRVEPTLIDEYVPAPRDAFRVVNDVGEVAEDSVTEDQDTAQAMADELNAEVAVPEGDRMYVVGVYLGPDGSNAVKVLRHPSGERIYSTSVIGGEESGFRLSMERATEFMWKDVREQVQS